MSNVIRLPLPETRPAPDPLSIERLGFVIGVIRKHAAIDIMVQMTPEAAGAIADLIEDLAKKVHKLSEVS